MMTPSELRKLLDEAERERRPPAPAPAKYECDCGAVYSNLDALYACQNRRHK